MKVSLMRVTKNLNTIKMKVINKILFFGVLLSLASACDYNEINFEGLDEDVSPTDIKSLEYTLTDDDYSTIASNSTNIALATTNDVLAELTALDTSLAFSSTLPAADYIPAFLDDLYYTADDGSAIEVTYNQGSTDDLSAYESNIYTLGSSDYAEVNSTVGLAKSFTPTYMPDDYLPDLIAAEYPDAVEGDICLVYYNYTDEEPEVGQSSIFSESFEEGSGDFQMISFTGDDVWYSSSYSSDYFMKMSGYQEENEDWLITPQIDLSSETDPVLVINQAANYVYDQWSQITVNISTDYDGSGDSASVANATWTPLTITTLPAGDDYVFVETEDIDLSDYEGEKIYIAFKYISTLTYAATWEINDVDVLSLGLTASGISQKGTYYEYSGTEWTEVTSAYALSADDYTEMGFTYKNFSSDYDPDNYLPQFLSQKYPYAQEDDEIIVGYKYYSSGTTYLADSYSYLSGTWTKASDTEEITDQFVKANGVWNYNPSIVITLTPGSGNDESAEFYQAATDWVWENIDQAVLGVTSKGDGYVTSYGNNEYYTGCSAYYNNIDMRPAKAYSQYPAGYEGLTDDEITALMTEHLLVVLGETLSVLYPDATPIDGVDITYTINAAIYTGTSVYSCTHSFVYSLVGTGEFEYVSGPTAIE
jgi:hypothetical protein